MVLRVGVVKVWSMLPPERLGSCSLQQGTSKANATLLLSFSAPFVDLTTKKQLLGIPRFLDGQGDSHPNLDQFHPITRFSISHSRPHLLADRQFAPQNPAKRPKVPSTCSTRLKWRRQNRRPSKRNRGSHHTRPIHPTTLPPSPRNNRADHPHNPPPPKGALVNNMNSTVKRKFNALLQGISNGDTPNRPASDSATAVEDQPSTTQSTGLLPPTASTRALLGPESPPAQTPSIFSSPASTIRMGTSDLEYLGKKRRVAGPPSTPSKYGDVAASSPSRGPHTTTTISNVTLRKWTPSGSPAPPSSSGATSELKYCPGDRDQLLRRLATFQELTDWTPKPERVSEVEWAKRGWTCQGKERVQCALCGRELAVGVNRKEVDGKEISVLIASEVAEGVVNKYAELIVDGHGQDCLWRRKGCDGMSPIPHPPTTQLTHPHRLPPPPPPLPPPPRPLRPPPALRRPGLPLRLPPLRLQPPPPSHPRPRRRPLLPARHLLLRPSTHHHSKTPKPPRPRPRPPRLARPHQPPPRRGPQLGVLPHVPAPPRAVDVQEPRGRRGHERDPGPGADGPSRSAEGASVFLSVEEWRRAAEPGCRCQRGAGGLGGAGAGAEE